LAILNISSATASIANHSSGWRFLPIWPYAVAPAIAGVLWLFMFNPSLGIIAWMARGRWRMTGTIYDGGQAMALIVVILGLEADQLQFPVLPRRAAGHPEIVIEAAAIDGASPGGGSGPSSSRSCRPPPSSCWW
jgi:sn-glycerol 3-phosphate transport system permease protein